MGDRHRIQQVLGNLVGNAMKFTRTGHVWLRVRLEPPEEADVRQLHFEVADEGIGIPVAAQPRMFEPFVQASHATAREFGGTGLGLAISRRLVHLMNGDIDFSSTPGQGSRFVIRLPVG